MEPILKNSQFTLLIKVWKFITTYHDYLQLPQATSLMSLYQLDEHIKNQTFMTTFISQLIQTLVRKSTQSRKNSKHQTILALARNNKFGLLEDLIKTSSYALGHSQVNCNLLWLDHQQIDHTKSFEALSISDKYRYLSWLVSFVNVSTEFKLDYMQNLKKQYSEACQQPGRKHIEIYQTFGLKLAPSYILGKDSHEKSYVYIPKIGDCILCLDMKKNEWTQIIGHENVNKQILEKLMNPLATPTNEQIDLVQSIMQILSKPGWKISHSAFDKTTKQFNINQPSFIQNKLQKIKLKMHELDQNYTKFISDCFNFRWASKQRRLQYHKQIEDAKNMKDLVVCFGEFFNETKNTIERKIHTLEFYDHSLDSKDVELGQFKRSFLNSNYLYSKGVISTEYKLQSYSVNLYSHIKSFLAEPDTFQPYFYEYLTIFVECMLGIIKDMYPGQYQKRLKQLKKLEDIKEQSRKRGNLMKEKQNSKGKRIKNELKNVYQSSEQSQSQTTAEQNKKVQQLPGLHRRLRQKMRINYNSNSNPRSQSIAIKAQKLLQRNAKSKKSKMKLDSDSDDDDVDLSLSGSDTEKDKGLNLDGYRYVDEDETNKFKCKTRNSRS